MLAHCFYPPYITEEIGTQRTVTVNRQFNNIQMGRNQFENLFIRRCLFVCNPFHRIGKHLQFRFDYSHINLLFTLEISIKRTSSLLRSHGNIIHCRSIHPLLGKELAGYIN